MKGFRAENSSELITVLRYIDITLPPRNEGRTTEHCETWSICRLLATLERNNRLVYPLQLTKRERPDYLLQAGNHSIGVEVTEAINDEYAKAVTLPEANESVVDPSLFKWGMPRRSLPALRSIVSRTRLTGPGWDGNSVEREYADAVFDIMLSKTKKLRKKGFEKFTENWLLIYCNITLPMLNLEEASLLFLEKSSKFWSKNSFSRVFVEEGRSVVEYSSDKAEIMPLNDLWKSF